MKGSAVDDQIVYRAVNSARGLTAVIIGYAATLSEAEQWLRIGCAMCGLIIGLHSIYRIIRPKSPTP
jgi:hypothetical protein